MLGYIRAHAPQLRLCEYECYRAAYCGLCRHMGKCTGACSRMTLSYDFVFLAAVRFALSGEEPQMAPIRCAIHPLAKRKAVKDSPTLAYCADASALLTYHKCRDDIADEHGLRRLRARLISLALRRGYRKARRRQSELDAHIRDALAALSTHEKASAPLPSAEIPAACFGEVMAAVFSEGLPPTEARIAASLGQSIGRWIYLADAADDFAEDCQKNRYNPYRALFGQELDEAARERIRLSLTLHLSEAERAFLLIDCYPSPEWKEILCNILYLGLPATADRILSKQRKDIKS